MAVLHRRSLSVLDGEIHPSRSVGVAGPIIGTAASSAATIRPGSPPTPPLARFLTLIENFYNYIFGIKK